MAMCNRFLSVLATMVWGCGAVADTLSHLGTFAWPTEGIVGLSGLEVSKDGREFHAVSDQGWFLSGTFAREGPRISGVAVTSFLPMLDSEGWPMAARRVGDLSDAEGLAIGPDGTLWVSFERWARVARYDTMTANAGWIADHPIFASYADNRQLEALAIAPDGAIYTFPEKPESAGFPIYRLMDDTWQITGHVPDQDRFWIVGADFDDDGVLYILERKLVLGLWWQNRIRRLDITNPDSIETLWTSARGEFHNIEGLAVWQDDIGQRITVISDNNSDQDEPTQIIEFRVRE